ncbi:hypothetical protein ACFVWG_15040 [Kribbella sp. NPDC058245]|uniref:hypothetical protein n=1 Tax=Kribbella sp. NPDC058245 TaxID=3346399 RepID=UPI0036ED699A
MTSTAAKALGAWLGLGALLLIGLIYELPALSVLLVGWMLVYFVVAGFVVADAIRLRRRQDLHALQASANLVKIAAIPFFVLNFVALTRVVIHVGSADKDHFGLRGFLTALLFVVLTYLVLLPTSAYTVGCLTLMRKTDRIGPVFYGLHLILQFLFVTDIVGAMVVIEVARNRLGTARPPSVVTKHLLTGVLLVFSTLSTIWLVVVGVYYLDWRIFVGTTLDFQLAIVPAVAFMVLVVVPVVPLVALRIAVRYFLADDLDALRRSNRAVKLTMIPLFVQNLVLALVITGVLSALSLYLVRSTSDLWFTATIASLSLAPGLICGYLMLLPTSIYGIACLALLMRRRAITPAFCAVNVIAHLFFVTDVISALVVARRAGHILAGRSNG